MNVGELRKLIANVDDDVPVCVDHIGYANRVSVALLIPAGQLHPEMPLLVLSWSADPDDEMVGLCKIEPGPDGIAFGPQSVRSAIGTGSIVIGRVGSGHGAITVTDAASTRGLGLPTPRKTE